MKFHDTRFPIDIALNAEGGPVRRTDIVTLVSGFEERNSPWASSRRRFNAGYGVKSLRDIEQIISFFEARHGRLYSFRFRDPFDHQSAPIGTSISSSDQAMGVGDGSQTTFPLQKSYTNGPSTWLRLITKPVQDSVKIAINDTEIIADTDYIINYSTGEVEFSTPPPVGATLTAGYAFDVPVRFDTDELSISLTSFKVGDIPNIPIVEVLGE